MPAANYQGYRSPTAFEKFKKSIALELEYLPDTMRAHPIKTAAASVALFTGLSIGASSLHDHLLEAQVKPQMLTQTSHQATATTFGIHRYGTIFNGVAVKNLEKDDIAGRLINQATARHVPAGDKEVGCKVVTLTADSKSLLSYAFGSKATVTTFNQPAFANGDYSCQGISLETSIPRPLTPSLFLTPKPVSSAPLI